MCAASEAGGAPGRGVCCVLGFSKAFGSFPGGKGLLVARTHVPFAGLPGWVATKGPRWMELSPLGSPSPWRSPGLCNGPVLFHISDTAERVGPVLFNIFTSDTAEGVGCTLSTAVWSGGG